jgi:hypothetical protein
MFSFFYILEGVKLAVFRLLLTRLPYFRIQDKRLPRLCKPVLNIAFVYDDERLLFKQTYLRWRSTLWEQ